MGAGAGRASRSGALAAAILALLQAAPAGAQPSAGRALDISEFRIRGSTRLPQGAVEEAVYPFLGPARKLEDVEAARAALEKLYADRGFASVTVAIPPQTVRGGLVILEVTEGRVGRLRVRGARWFSPWEVRRLAPSLAEGEVPRYGPMLQDILELNQVPDRRVTPMLRAGAVPGTVDVDLSVEDRLPLHASLELNNRHGRDTQPERLAGSLRYENLWQLGHALSFDFQFAPQSRDPRALFHPRPYPDARVATAGYLVRFPGTSWLTLAASATYQDSVVDTSGATVEGTGRLASLRAAFTLPGGETWFHSITLTPGWKEMGQRLEVGGKGISAPITYWPLTAEYGGSLAAPGLQLQVSLGATWSLRPLGASVARFDDRRYQASGAFVLYRGQAALTLELPLGLQLVAGAQGQHAPAPLLPSEQFSAGGEGTVRGYLTSEVVGDVGAQAGIELASPSLSRLLGERWVNEWRFHLFAEGAWAGNHLPLPEQRADFRLLGVGVGTRLRLVGHLRGGADLALPLRSEGITRRHVPRLHFRVVAEL